MLITFRGDADMADYVAGLMHQLRTMRRPWYKTSARDPLVIELEIDGR